MRFASLVASYQAVGGQHPRPQRGLLTRPSLNQVLAYRADVDQRMLRLLTASAPNVEQLALSVFGLWPLWNKRE